MNRTDRLVALVMLLQSRRITTAAQMAEHFEVTERTIYRDLAALGEGGVPIMGEPGVGYSLMRGYHLPPVMFSPDEALALVTAGMLAERMTDASMREAIRSALGKVGAVLPADLQGRVQRLRQSMQVNSRAPNAGPVSLSRVQMALAEARVLDIRYHGARRGETTTREVEPLGLAFYLEHWHLIAWCRLRQEVRDFRVDRIQDLRVLPDACPPRRDFHLAEYLAQCWRPEMPHTAVLEISDKVLETARRHWGPTLIEEKREGPYVRVSLAYGDAEVCYLARWVLSLGAMVSIVEPESVREAVIAQARETVAHHQANKSTGPKRS